MYTVLYTNTSRLKYMYRNGLKISGCSSKTFWPLREISISFLLTILSASQILRSLEWRKWSPTKGYSWFLHKFCLWPYYFFQRCLLKGYKCITDFLILLFFRVCGMRTHTKIRHSNTVLAWLDQNLLVLCRYLVNLKLAKSVQKNILVNEKISIFLKLYFICAEFENVIIS